MNLLAHIRVARRISDDPAVWLGAALPDLQREAGVAIGDLLDWPGAVRAGIECHHVADAVFHDLPVFRSQARALNAALQAAGVSRGAARAVAHAGWELLFDGALLDDAELVQAYLAAMSVDVSSRGAAWRDALARRQARGAPTLYADPTGVARLLQRVLSARRLLAFDQSEIGRIAAVLRDAQPAIVGSVDEVFAAFG